MDQIIRALVQHGKLELLEPIDLPEGEEVHLTIVNAPPTAVYPIKRWLFVLLLLASGFCGISYEILYGRMLGNLIGDQFAVSASILLTFLLGIGCGTWYAHRLWRYLWLIEAAIGVYAVAFALNTHTLDTFLYTAGGRGLASNVFLCLVLLSLPSFLIGCSLPLFAGYLSRLETRQVFARAYTVYNVGAAVTALLIEYWLLRDLGIRQTVCVIAALNGGVALGLLAGFRDLWAWTPPATTRVRFPRHHLLALAVVSVASAVFQLLMVKLAESVFGPFRETFALVLAVVFLGIAVGSAVTRTLRLGFTGLLVANCLGLAWLLGGFGWMVRWYASLYPIAVEGYVTAALLKLTVIVLAMGLPAITFGATIPALLRDQRHVARESGQLLFVSSMANAAGFLLMAFVLHRWFDYGVLVILVAALTCVSLVLYGQGRFWRVLSAVVILLTLVGLQRQQWDEPLLYLGHTSFHSMQELTETRSKIHLPERFKGAQDTFSINWLNGNPFFFINGFISFQLNSPYEKLVGAYGALFAPRTDKALVLGLGSGATGGSVSLLFDTMDAVEINPVVIENLYRMKEWNFDIESRQPRVNIVLDDAIHYTKASQERYSLIINTVTTPLYFSSSKLYTHDFFQAVRDRLTPDGVYITWVDARVGDRGLDIILKTLSQSFRECWLGVIRGSYFMVISSQQPIAIRNPRLAAEQPLLNAFLYAEGKLRPDWIAYSLMTTRAYEVIENPQTPINTLDYPALEFEIARLRKRGIEEFKARLLRRMDLAQIATVLQPVMPFDPVAFAVYNDVLHGPSAIAKRWKALVEATVPDFQERFEALKARYYAGYADAVNVADAHHSAGMRLLRTGLCEEAIEAFGKALRLDPQRDNAYFNIGSCYERLGQFDLSLAHYQLELTVDPKDDDVPFRMGRVSYQLQRYDAALALLNSAVALNPDAETYHYRGLVFEALGQTDKATRDFAVANKLRTDPKAAPPVAEEGQPGRSEGGG